MELLDKIIKVLKFVTKSLMPFAVIAWIIYTVIVGNELLDHQRDVILLLILLGLSNIKIK